MAIIENDIPVGEVAAYLVLDDGKYFVEELDGTRGDECAVIEDGKTVALKPNGSGRQWIVVDKVAAYFAENDTDKYPLLKRGEKRTLGSYKLKDPNENIAKYLSEEEKAEYDSIVAAARARYEAAHPKKEKKALTAEEKALKNLSKTQADLQALLEANPDNAQIADVLAAIKEALNG